MYNSPSFVGCWPDQTQSACSNHTGCFASIQGPDYMVRVAKKSMLEELEAMLEVVDPQPPGKQRSLSRRKFDLPEGGAVSDEKVAGVNKAVRIIQEGKWCRLEAATTLLMVGYHAFILLKACRSSIYLLIYHHLARRTWDLRDRPRGSISALSCTSTVIHVLLWTYNMLLDNQFEL